MNRTLGSIYEPRTDPEKERLLERIEELERMQQQQQKQRKQNIKNQFAERHDQIFLGIRASTNTAARR